MPTPTHVQNGTIDVQSNRTADRKLENI